MKVESNAWAQGVWTFANWSMLNLDAIVIAFDPLAAFPKPFVLHIASRYMDWDKYVHLAVVSSPLPRCTAMYKSL